MLWRLVCPCFFTYGLLRSWEFFITSDHFDTWRKHIVFAKDDGRNLKELFTQRYATILVILSLLLNAELGVLFSNSNFGNKVRNALENIYWEESAFWVGLFVCISFCTTFLGMMATVTAWGALNTVSDPNIIFILRSDIGLAGASLPFRFLTATIHLCIWWLFISIIILAPVELTAVFLCLAFIVFINHSTLYSSFMQFIMKTGAMGEKAMFDEIYQQAGGSELDKMLLTKSKQLHITRRDSAICDVYNQIRQSRSYSETHELSYRGSLPVFGEELNRARMTLSDLEED